MLRTLPQRSEFNKKYYWAKLLPLVLVVAGTAWSSSKTSSHPSFNPRSDGQLDLAKSTVP